MDLGKSLSYVFSDPKWVKKILLAAFIMLLPVLGQTIAAGWLLDTLRNIRAGQEHPIPDWSGDDLARWLGRGIAATVAVMAWIVPCMLVLSIISGCGLTAVQVLSGGVLTAIASGGKSASDLATGLGSAAIIVNCCLACLLFLVGLIVVLGALVPYVRFAATDRMDVGLEYLANFKLLFANIGPFLLVVLVMLVAGFVAALLQVITCGIASLVTVPYLGLVFAYLAAGLSRKLETAKPTTAEPATA
jgi:Protein of unknown function (DUF4013)